MANLDVFQGLMNLSSAQQNRIQMEKDERYREEVQKPYVQAITNYQNVLIDEAMDSDLKEIQRQLGANQAAMTGLAFKQEKAKWDYVQELMGGDEEQKSLGRQIWLGTKENESLQDQLDILAAQNDQIQTLIDVLAFGLQQEKQRADQAESAMSIAVGGAEVGKQLWGEKTWNELIGNQLGSFFGITSQPNVTGKKQGLFGWGGYPEMGLGTPADVNEPNQVDAEVLLNNMLRGGF